MQSAADLKFEKIELTEDSSRLSGAVFAFICVLPPVSAVIYGGVDTGTWALISLLIGAMAVLWLLDGWMGRGLLLNLNPLLLPLSALALIGVIQIALGLSLDPYSTRLLVIRLAAYTIFLAAVLTFVNTSRRLKVIVGGVIAFGALMAFFGILQRIAEVDAIYGLRPPGQAIPFGPFINQHHFAAFMEMTAALSLALLLARSVTREKKLLIGLCLFFNVAAIVLTGSRGGLLGFISGAAFVAFVSYLIRKRRGIPKKQRTSLKLGWLIGAVAGLFLFIGFISLVGGENSLLRVAGATGVGDDLTNGRLHFWSVAWQIFVQYPILGAGLDAFGVAFTPHDTWNGAFRVEQAHNDYLQTLADSGVVGLAIVIAFVVLLFRKGLAVITQSRDGFRLHSAIGALGGCFAIAIHSFFDFPLRTPSNAFFFLLLAGIATVTISGSKDRD